MLDCVPMNASKAIDAINKCGILLVFPVANTTEPASLWSSFFPKTVMRWEWDEGGDNRVAKLWHLRAELSSSSEVVYSKWYRGRATVFSRSIFTALLALRAHSLPSKQTDLRARLAEGLSSQAKELLKTLEIDSPISPKALKLATGLRGRENESSYERALKELWSRFLIVGFGEIDEGAFPSLAIGATSRIFEDLWTRAEGLSAEKANDIIAKAIPKNSLFLKFFEKVQKTQAGDSKKKAKKKPHMVRFQDL